MNRRQAAKRFVYAVVTKKGEIPCMCLSGSHRPQLDLAFSATREGARFIKRELDRYSVLLGYKRHPHKIKKFLLQMAETVR